MIKLKFGTELLCANPISSGVKEANSDEERMVFDKDSFYEELLLMLGFSEEESELKGYKKFTVLFANMNAIAAYVKETGATIIGGIYTIGYDDNMCLKESIPEFKMTDIEDILREYIRNQSYGIVK